ncbi:MAG: anthranilate phosphoribosyltransferase, partial [Acutalibacteraceae bacterium]|nr:anthranilate phosphoribosyltransferase [Acutalibacteraceae bacterium]
ALVAAAGGIKVAKHGNRAASSSSGTADVQEALGVNIAQDADKCRELLDEVGLCFMFAQKYHTSMKYVGPIRKELGIRTVFNILGPLTNPAKPTYMVLGVYDEYLVHPLARVLADLGVKRGMVVYGKDRMDEISASSESTVAEINNGWYKTYTVKPEDFGLTRGTKEELVGGSAEENAKITRDVLSGREQGTRRNAVLMNAGACFYLTGKADTLAKGVEMAAEVIDSGKALETLERYVEASNR